MTSFYQPITPASLLEHAIEKYKEMLENPKSEGHKRFLIKELKRLMK